MFSSINGPHWHLLLNHLPVVGVMGGVLLLIYGLARRSSDVIRASLWSFVLVAILAFAAHATGDPAAAAIRDLPGVDRGDIRAHDQASGTAMLVSIGLGVLAIVALILGSRKKDKLVDSTDPNYVRSYVRFHKSPPMAMVLVCLIVGLIDCGLMLWVANLGGQIRHPEIRNVAPGLPKSS